MSDMWAILSIRVENKPGILFKVTHLFRARNFNIDSISVGVMENPEFSKMTITTVGTEKQIAQIVKQLDKMIDTIEVKRLDERKRVCIKNWYCLRSNQMENRIIQKLVS